MLEEDRLVKVKIIFWGILVVALLMLFLPEGTLLRCRSDTFSAVGLVLSSCSKEAFARAGFRRALRRLVFGCVPPFQGPAIRAH